MPISTIKDSAASLASMYKAVSKTIQKSTGNEFMEELNINEGDFILDIGCGTAELAAVLAEKVGEEGKVIGIDPDIDRLFSALENFGSIPNLSFLEGKAETLPFIIGEFDLVFCNHVYHWIREKDLALNRILRCLKPGGFLAILAPDMVRLPSPIIEMTNLMEATQFHKLNEALRFQERATIEELSRKAGFIIERGESQESEVKFKSLEHLAQWFSATVHGMFKLEGLDKNELRKLAQEWQEEDGTINFKFKMAKIICKKREV